MTMIERVAASIVIAQQRGLDRNGVARAAVEAMREPTNEMCVAGWKYADTRDAILGNGEVASLFNTMIDQALKDEA